MNECCRAHLRIILAPIAASASDLRCAKVYPKVPRKSIERYGKVLEQRKRKIGKMKPLYPLTSKIVDEEYTKPP